MGIKGKKKYYYGSLQKIWFFRGRGEVHKKQYIEGIAWKGGGDILMHTSAGFLIQGSQVQNQWVAPS